MWGLTPLIPVFSRSIGSIFILFSSGLLGLMISLGFPTYFFKAKAVKPPVELAPTAVNCAVVMQAGHMVGFVSIHLLQRTRTGVLDTFVHRRNNADISQIRQ